MGYQTSMSFEMTVPEPIEVYLEASNYNGYGVSCQGAADGFINVEVSGGIEEEIDDDYYGELIYYFTWYKDNLIYSTPFSNVSNGISNLSANISGLEPGLYTLDVIDQNSCQVIPFTSIEITESIFSFDSNNDGICDDDETFGCTDPEACNYNQTATNDDQSCYYNDITINTNFINNSRVLKFQMEI